MSENMEQFRHLDGNPAVVEQDHVHIVFQHGNPAEVGINGCRIEDVIEAVIDKLSDFQSRALACEENETALHHLTQARDQLVLRGRRREEQGVIGSRAKHKGA